MRAAGGQLVDVRGAERAARKMYVPQPYVVGVNENDVGPTFGGIRRGSDVVKALCLGARAVMAGRAYAYGLGAAGGAGVARAIEILRTDLIRTLKLLGCPSIAALDRSYVDVAADWLRK